MIVYGAESSDVSLLRYFTPGTKWKLLRPSTIEDLEGAAWLETSAIDQLASTAEGARWLETHARKESLKQLADSGFRIRFLRVEP